MGWLFGSTFVSCWILSVVAQDYSVYGLVQNYLVVINPRKRSEVYSNCFAGLSLTTCLPKIPNDDIVRNYDMLYYQNMASIVGQFYCLQCCGNPPDYTDTWDLSCPLTPVTVTSTNIYGGEIWLARKQNDADTELVRCAIKRTACAYNEQGLTVNCDNRATDTTFLHGYTVTIRVLRYDKNFAFWRGVSKCEVESVESDVPLAAGDIFYEKIIMMHEPIDTFSADDYGKIAIITLTLFVIMYAALYFFRRKHCEYCQQKLVFSRRLCYKCVLVGAQPPDPVLLKALEERGENMQGTLPKRLGFVQLWFENCGKCLYSCFTCQCCCNCCCVCFRFCCCCGCCSYCCGCQKKDEHKTFPGDDCAMMAVEAIELGEGLSMTRDDVEDFTQSLDDERDESKTRKKPRKKGVKTVDPPVVGQTEGVTADMKKKKKRNPNILDQPPEIIYKAVKLPYNL